MKINSRAPTGKQYKTDNENVLKISRKGGTAFPHKVTFELSITEQEKVRRICRERTPKVAKSTGKEITVMKAHVPLRKDRW